MLQTAGKCFEIQTETLKEFENRVKTSNEVTTEWSVYDHMTETRYTDEGPKLYPTPEFFSFLTTCFLHNLIEAQ